MPEQAEDFERLQALFEMVVDLPPEDRERALEQNCDDPELRRRVLAILAGADLPEEAPTDGAALPPGGRIGQYRLLELLGSGGLGSVYLAERFIGGAPYRVALKMLAPHAAGPFFVERFHREQHILASLDHPHITKMLDAGVSESGQPYLTMEYVQGQHLDVFCDEMRLPINDRVRLMLQVCDAVGYAHRNLIVHLDLKPSNILVTNDGSVKLLDFGTSKLIKPDSLLTTTLLATPAFASPEQLRNEAVTTACDVYSLGAILFQLLAGERPGGKASAAVLFERAMNEAEPDRLTGNVTEEAAAIRGLTAVRLRQMLRGDLEVIAAKCLRARPRDRYLSVDALADDLRRYLDGRPVLATPQTAAYRIGKFVRRNRNAVIASALATLIIVSSLTYAAVRQQQALRDARRAVAMQTFMAQLFKLASTNYTGKPAATVPEFLKLGAQVLPQMIKNPADQRDGELSLAESMYFDSDFPDAEAALERVVADAKASNDIPTEAEAEAYAGMVAYKLNKMQDYTTLMDHALLLADKPGVTPSTRVYIKTFYTQNRYERGYTNDNDIAIQRAAVKEAHDPTVSADELAYATLNLALVASNSAPLPEQLKLTEEAVAIYKSEPYAICDAAGAEQVLGFLYQQSADTKASIELFRSSYKSFEQCRGEESHDALAAAGYLGLAMVSGGQEREAIPQLEATIQKLNKVMGPDNMGLNAPMVGLGRAYLAVGQFKQAEDDAARLFHILDGKVNPLSNQMGIVHLIWARALAGQNRNPEALAQAELADKAFAGEASKLPGAIANAKRAHQLVLDLQARTGQKKP